MRNADLSFVKNYCINQNITHLNCLNFPLSLDTNEGSTEWLAQVIISSLGSMKLYDEQK